MSTKEKQSVKVSVSEMVSVLNEVKNQTTINLVMLTDVRMNKTNNPYFGQVKKLTECRYHIGVDYEKRVNNNEKKEGMEGTFESLKPSGKTHISKCVLVDDKTGTKHYLMVERFDEIKPKVEFFHNGNTIDKMLFEDFLVKTSDNSRQEQQRKVNVFTVGIENIKEMSLNGVHYVVE